MKESKMPLFRSGDIGGMANRLAKKEGRTDVTALPSGVSTPAMFVYLWGIIAPLNYAIGDPEKVWMVAVAATFLGGVIEALGSVVGPWLRRFLPRAALLGTVGGIALVWMINKGFYDVYADPILGMPVLIIAIIGLIGGYVFPKKIPALMVAVIGGMLYAAILGRIHPDVSGFGFTLMSPIGGIRAIIGGMSMIGFIHAPSLGFSLNPFFFSYLILAAICFLFNAFRKSFTVPEGFDYV